MAAAHHRERVGGIEVAAALDQGDVLLGGVDQVRVLGAGFRCGADAENAVFTVVDHLAAFRHVVGDHHGHANAQIHVAAVRNVLGQPFGHLRGGKTVHLRLPSWATTRSTKMPGVATLSGLRSPSSTMCSTSATVISVS